MLKEFMKKGNELEEERSKLVSYMNSRIDYWLERRESNKTDNAIFDGIFKDFVFNTTSMMVDNRTNIKKAGGFDLRFIERQFKEFEAYEEVLRRLFEEKDSV